MFNPVLSSVLILLKMYMEINLKEHKLTWQNKLAFPMDF